MPKSWFTLGGSIVFLVTVVALYFSTEQQRTGERLETSLQSLLPAVIASTSPAMDISANGDRWAMPSYQEQIAAWQNQQANITLDETDLATPQGSSTTDESPSLQLSDADVVVQNTPDFIAHLKQGLASLSDRQDGLQRLRPMLGTRSAAISFQPSDHISIERYANRQHLLEGTPELNFLDAGAIELLLSFRRVLIEDIADVGENTFCYPAEDAATGEEQPICLEVAPGGGRYWLEDPNAAWW
ncbi:hypothetical protein [Leptolyngbya iicbica]|uniref:Uncharacterized protein n=2 Tax=Cyanophyceae TaxID=3028117 RepID=A0A4Q7E880_9CYAN|nr:hypothetical protein [Leptolyngbya sp. LK]RZM79380.1 hypothetical protein DYY88_11575 [Leptolyngbya sp. LK]